MLNKNILNILSLDVEKNGLNGPIVAIGVKLYDWHGEEIRKFGKRLSALPNPYDNFIRDEVYPYIQELEPTDDLIQDFCDYYVTFSGVRIRTLAHVVQPCESQLLEEMKAIFEGSSYDINLIFPLIDIAGCLEQVGENHLSVDDYLEKYGYVRSRLHNPLIEVDNTLTAYLDLKKRFPIVENNSDTKTPFSFWESLFCKHRVVKHLKSYSDAEYIQKIDLGIQSNHLFQCVSCGKNIWKNER